MQGFLRRSGALVGVLCLGVLPAAGGERVAGCPSGPGFVAVPGSDTCLRLSGRVAAGAAAANRRGPAEPGAEPRLGGHLSVDARTATEAGPVRAFVRLDAGQRRTGPFP
jgi:hypothetical protein